MYHTYVCHLQYSPDTSLHLHVSKISFAREGRVIHITSSLQECSLVKG